MLCLVRYLFVISTSVIDCLGRFVPEMTYYVSSGMLNLTKLTKLNSNGLIKSSIKITIKSGVVSVFNRVLLVQDSYRQRVCYRSMYTARNHRHKRLTDVINVPVYGGRQADLSVVLFRKMIMHS